MKKFLLKIWSVVNSPLFDFILGFIFLIASLYFGSLSEVSVFCTYAFYSGLLLFLGSDFLIQCFVDCCKSSGSPDDDKK